MQIYGILFIEEIEHMDAEVLTSPCMHVCMHAHTYIHTYTLHIYLDSCCFIHGGLQAIYTYKPTNACMHTRIHAPIQPSIHPSNLSPSFQLSVVPSIHDHP